MMKCLLIFGCIFVNFAINDARISDSLKVTLPHGGQLIGRYLSSHSGRGIRAFMGVPYAEPPLGSLRFRNPVPKSPWIGPRSASQQSEACLSVDYLFYGNESIGNEDCLYLNVYVPQKSKSNGPLPVMVYFHGGGWQSGSGAKSWYGPDYLLDEDVILVVGNYRLGVFGFLSTNSLECPGNFGLKDQNLILKWVQENIETFGGDKDCVTIFGQSAGGASVSFHTVSPLSRGLFHRAISHSGTHYGLWALQKASVAAEKARRLAEALKCPANEENVQEMLECLRGISTDEILSHFYDFFYWDIFPIIFWAPVVEPQSDGAFMYENPKVTQGKDFPHVPLMIGVTSDEGILISPRFTKKSQFTDDIKSNFTDLLPYILAYNDENAKIPATNIIKEFYFKDHEVDLNDEKIFRNFTDLLSDGYFTIGVDNHLQHLHPDSLTSNTFLYLFNHMGESSFAELIAEDVNYDEGVCHLDELIYLFPMMKNKKLFKGIPTEKDDLIRETMVTLWVNFAKTGNPTPYENKYPIPHWDTAGPFPYNYLRIGNFKQDNSAVIAMEKGLYDERTIVWRQFMSTLAESP